ncbi:MAG: adenosine deaminase [Patescibacteria group bacterium]|nr:adenosine deaminase [Patescibacteria group bacterium]
MGINYFADLHLHLGASTSSHLLWELAHEQGIKLQEKNYWDFIKKLEIKETNNNNYLRRLDKNNHSPFFITQLIQSSPYAIEKSVHQTISYFYRMADVRLIEIRFNPLLRNRNGEFDVDKIILSALIGMQKAMIDYPIKAGLILETDRQFDYKKSKIIFEKAVKYKKLGIVGIDVSGPNPSSKFEILSLVDLYNFAKKNDLKTTIHTGEFTDIDEVWQVVEKISPNRIGHGIVSYKDKKLLEAIKKKNIVLEICPTSNIKTKVVKDWDEFRKIIKFFLKNDILFTINSDGPEFFNTNVKKEFQMLLKNKILNKNQTKKIISYGFKYSFI